MDRADLHRLIDQIPRRHLAAVARVLEALRDLVAGEEEDPVARALENAPEDDEPTTEDDLRALKEGREAARRGEGVPAEEFWAALEAEGRL